MCVFNTYSSGGHNNIFIWTIVTFMLLMQTILIIVDEIDYDL